MPGTDRTTPKNAISSFRINACVRKFTYERLSERNLGEMIEVVARSRSGLPHERRLTEEEAKAFTLSDPDFDPDGTWLVSLEGRAVGFGVVAIEGTRISAGKDDGQIDVDVVPECRGFGIEQDLLNRSITYLRGKGLRRARSRCPVADQWKASLLISDSFREYYRVYVLLRKGKAEPPVFKLPGDFSIERKLLADHSDDEMIALGEAFNESFIDHLDFAPEIPERFIMWRDSHPDPMIVATAMRGSTIAGFCISEESLSYNKERGANTGWIEFMGVKPQFRRKGLARALLADGIRWLLEKGMDDIHIGVISQNEKALDLYKSFGFEMEHETIWFEKSTGAQGSDEGVRRRTYASWQLACLGATHAGLEQDLGSTRPFACSCLFD